VLKGSVKLRQRRLVNEVLGLLVTEFVRNFSREDATPYQRGSNSGLPAVKFIRHNTSRIFRAPTVRGSPVARIRFKGAGARWGHGFNKQIFGANEPSPQTATTPLKKRSALSSAERIGPNSILNPLSYNLPRP